MIFFLETIYLMKKKFLNQIVENCSKEIKDCEVSFYFSRKKIMSIYCKTSVMTKTIANNLLDIVDLLIEQHFFLFKWFKTTRLVCALYEDVEEVYIITLRDNFFEIRN